MSSYFSVSKTVLFLQSNGYNFLLGESKAKSEFSPRVSSRFLGLETQGVRQVPGWRDLEPGSRQQPSSSVTWHQEPSVSGRRNPAGLHSYGLPCIWSSQENTQNKYGLSIGQSCNLLSRLSHFWEWKVLLILRPRQKVKTKSIPGRIELTSLS